jgi:hypothetical protein
MASEAEEEQDTETKLAILSSIFTKASPESLFDVLIQADGDVNRAIDLQLDSGRRYDLAPPSKRQRTSSSLSPSKGSLRLKWTASAEPPRKVALLFAVLTVGATSNTTSLSS